MEDSKVLDVKNELSKEVLAKVKIRRQFEIFVEEFDEEGGPGHTPIWKAVKVDPTLGGTGGNPIIAVTSQADLQEKMNFYKQLGQRFRIVREIDPPSREAILKAAEEQGLIDKSESHVSESEETEPTKLSATEEKINVCSEKTTLNASVKKKPKIITIGDMQIKYDGDKVYQKQWMKLTQNESSNFRVVNDASNKMVSMAGKHIEAKRWVLVENSTTDEDNTEEIINA